MAQDMTFEELKVYCQKLENYLSLALSDFERVCAEPNGFMKVCNLYRKEFYIESDIKNLLTDKELNTVTKLGLDTKVTTHSYKTGHWSWRYSDDVKRLIGVEV